MSEQQQSEVVTREQWAAYLRFREQQEAASNASRAATTQVDMEPHRSNPHTNPRPSQADQNPSQEGESGYPPSDFAEERDTISARDLSALRSRFVEVLGYSAVAVLAELGIAKIAPNSQTAILALYAVGGMAALLHTVTAAQTAIAQGLRAMEYTKLSGGSASSADGDRLGIVLGDWEYSLRRSWAVQERFTLLTQAVVAVLAARVFLEVLK